MNELDHEKDLPIVLLFTNNREHAIKVALSNYTNDVALLVCSLFQSLHGAFNNIVDGFEGWNVLTWEDYKESKQVKPNTIIKATSTSSVAGIEVKNVIYLKNMTF